MRFSRLILLTLLAALTVAAPAHAVAGGTTVDISTVPYVVSDSACTGTLIAPDRVLTAAHCVEGLDPDEAYVIAGADAHDVTKVPDADKYPLKGYASAPGYKLAFPFAHKQLINATAVNDVAIIVLGKPVPGIQPIAVAGPGDAALEQPGRPVHMLGYGLLAAKPNQPFVLPPALQRGDLSVISRAQCLKAYPKAIERTTDICAQDLDTSGALTQPCPGDSGGPLIADGPNGPVEIGVTSWGAEVKAKKCGEARLPAVWMRVSAFHSFITNPAPVLAPHTSERRAAVKRDGHRLTCIPPKFEGSPAKVRYRWGIPRVKGQIVPEIPHPLKFIKGATKKTFTTGRKATRGKKVTCEIRASNAGGRWLIYSPSVAG